MYVERMQCGGNMLECEHDVKDASGSTSENLTSDKMLQNMQ